MSVSCLEELLSKSLSVNVKVENSTGKGLDKSSNNGSSRNHENTAPVKEKPSNSVYSQPGTAAQKMSSIFSTKFSTMTEVKAVQRCRELELELKTEREIVAKLKKQLDYSQWMLTELRNIHSRCPFRTRFDDLPEELIVTIFSYLDADTLLDVVSLVSSKWNRLAHDVVLWSQVSVKNMEIGKVVRLMEFAPYLRCVCISSEQLHVHDDMEDENLQVLTTSRCRVRSLTLPDFQPISLRMIRNQMGWLRHLHVNSWWDHMRLDYRDELWETIAQLDLVSLTLHEYDGGNSYFESPFRFKTGQMTNLHHLDLYCKTVPGEILTSLLLSCQNALVTVSLPPKALGEHVQLLSKCPQLREANVPFLREICSLEHNTLLDFIEINAEWVLEPEVESVVLFLKMPSVVERLQTLFFQGMPVGCRRLLHAVAWVRRLQYVRIHNFGEPQAVDAILIPLSCLMELERFTISVMPPSNVIDEILPEYCPRLRELCIIGLCCDDQSGCRIPAIKRLLRHRPLLHVFLDFGLGVSRHLEGAFPECLREHGAVCMDESLWHRFHPVLVNHDPEDCSWCLTKIEPYATVVCMQGRLD